MSRDPAVYREQLAAAAKFIKGNDDFLVVSHVSPDGDAISSTLAVGWLLQAMQKRVVMINEGAIPEKFSGLWRAAEIRNFSGQPPERAFSCIISADCADFFRIGKVSGIFSADYQLLNIDHHPTNDRFGSVNLVKDDAAATAEILYDLTVQLAVPWSRELCELVYTGLLTDTGGFRYANTSPKVMRIAAEMLQYGVPGSELAERFLEKLTMPQITLLQKALARLAFAEEHRIAWISLTSRDIAEAGASSDDLDGLVNYPRNIEGVDVGMLFKEVQPQQVKVSLRAGGAVDVSRVAQTFGGGGHVRAAGCSLSGTLDEVINRVVAEVGKALR